MRPRGVGARKMELDDGARRRVVHALVDGVSVTNIIRRFSAYSLREDAIRAIAAANGIDIRARKVGGARPAAKHTGIRSCFHCGVKLTETVENFPPRGGEMIGQRCATCEAGRIRNVEARAAREEAKQ